ncbi:transcriptional regulator [Mammaliicoccus sciuri]|nr:transcriptional regulator [Mammaliicoccus sciuri]
MNSWGEKHISSEEYEIITEEDNPNHTCQALTTINLIVGKWKIIIILELLEKDRRFNEFLKNIPSINRQMLTNQLHELLEEGIIDRKVYAEVPPKVVYSLTNYGRTLEPILLELAEWSSKFLKKRIY